MHRTIPFVPGDPDPVLNPYRMGDVRSQVILLGEYANQHNQAEDADVRGVLMDALETLVQVNACDWVWGEC